MFTKLLKPICSYLRKLGHTNVAYIDDILLQRDTYNECQQNIRDTTEVIDKLGLTYTPKEISS